MATRAEVEDFVSVPEGRIYFVKTGSGPPMVLLHPMGTSTWAWHRVMGPLGRHFTCYAFDMLGQGQSDKPANDLSIPDFARSTAYAMQALSIDKTHIIGNSVGGILAVELAASYPELVDRLVLIGTPVWGPSTALQRLEVFETGYDEHGLPKHRTLEEVRATNAFIDPRPEWVEKSNELRARAGIWYRKTMVALSWYDLAARLPRVRAAATLVLNGEHDGVRVDEEILRYNIPNASKVILGGLGHIPQVEGPEAFVSAVLDFLK